MFCNKFLWSLALLVAVSTLIYPFKLNALILPYGGVPDPVDEPQFTEFARIDPKDGEPHRLSNRVWLSYDDDNLYMRWEAEIDSSFDRGSYRARDQWMEADFVRIKVITSPASQYGYMYYAFPMGSLLDSTRNPDLNTDSSWDSNYSYTNEIKGNMWIVNMCIPFQDLRFRQTPPYEWKVILTRYEAKTRHFYRYPNVTIDMKQDFFYQAANVVLANKISSARAYTLIPYLVKKYDLMAKESSFDPDNIGLDLAYNPSNAMKLKVTFNPDFSDVPLDSERNTFNQKMPPYYSENRYFFTEDIDIFTGLGDIFYSRSVMQPRFALKLTGNSDWVSYGWLSAFDKESREGNIIYNHDDAFHIVALKPRTKDIQAEFLTHFRHNAGYFNLVQENNLIYQYLPKHKLHLSTAHTWLDPRDEHDLRDKAWGYSYSAASKHESGDWDLNLGFSDFSSDIHADMDYSSDGLAAINYNASLSYSRDSLPGYFRSYNAYISYSHTNYKDRSDKDHYVDWLANLSSTAFWSVWANGFLAEKFFHFLDSPIGYFQEWGTHRIGSIYYGGSYFKHPFLRFNLAGSYGHTYIYALEETRRSMFFSFAASGQLGTNLSYSTSSTLYHYDIEKTPHQDDVFLISDAQLRISPSNNTQWTSGISGSTYQTESTTLVNLMRFGLYSNFRWDFRPGSAVYLGFKTSQNMMERIAEIPLRYCILDSGTYWRKNYATAYLKVSYRI